MLGGLALKRRWQHRRKAAGKSTEKPNLVLGINAQICWDKFCELLRGRAALRADGRRALHLGAEEAVALCDENTIGVVADPRLDVRRRVRAGRRAERRARRPAGEDGPRHPDPRRRRVGRR